MNEQIPHIIERVDGVDRSFDIYSRLLTNRMIFLTGEIEDGKSNILIAQILYLDASDPNKDIIMFINSPGGVVTAGLALYDVMQYVKCDIRTICIGQASSMGAILLGAGKKGKRLAFPNSRIMLHQPIGGMEGVVSDIEIHAREILRYRQRLNEILASCTGQSLDVISRDTERDFFMDAQEALKYGVIDAIAENRS
ncbi:ATP-dependent Clp protease proteolytic subunit [Candidatus Sumerlaeota bacterium]|nr:ATP-dependent Clp protease proteolytic subunit [Candidatus Sumerlaeota bacterium]